MSDIKVNRSADEIQSHLERTITTMYECQKNGSYVEAQNQRVLSEQLKKDLQARRIYEMQQKHNQQHNDLKRAHEDQKKSFNLFWEKNFSQFNQEGEKLIRDLEAKHQIEQEGLRSDLQKQLSMKVKESSQFLNLKKMEEHMARQKLYTEAHKVQVRLQELEGSQKQAWITARNLKIQTSINTLRAKQANELAALQKKIKTGLDEQSKQKHREQGRLAQKYTNLEKELNASHDKQILAFRGIFRSKGGQGSPLLLSKSKLLSSSK